MLSKLLHILFICLICKKQASSFLKTKIEGEKNEEDYYVVLLPLAKACSFVLLGGVSQDKDIH